MTSKVVIDQLRRAIFARCRETGLDDDARRDIQRQVTGKASLTAMTPSEMRAVLHALGGREARPTTASLPRGPHTAKLRALWLSGWHLGVVRDRTDAGLAAWIKRQTGLDAARWATPGHAAAAIDALKAWLAREAGVDWSRYDAFPRAVAKPRARVLEAQRRILLRIERREDTHVEEAVASDAYFALDDADADRLIRRQGERIRRLRAHTGAVGARA